MFDYPQGDGERSGDLVFMPGLDEAGWSKLLSYTELRRFSPGDTVIRAGDVDDALYLLTRGRLGVFLPTRDGEREGSPVDAPTVVGEVAFFDKAPRSATLRALTEVDLLRLRADAFEALAAREPRLARDVLMDLGRILALRLRRAEAAQQAGGGRR